MTFIRMIAFILVLGLTVLCTAEACCETVNPEQAGKDRIAVKVLILPKFEVGEMDDGNPGEAEYYYKRYLTGAEAYEVPSSEGNKLYVKDGVALCLLGMGKVNAALNTMAILSDERFDFSNAYILSTGCAGSAAEASVMGDVFVVTAAVDYDLGHHADPREMTEDRAVTWFHDPDFDDAAVIKLNPELTEKVLRLAENVPVETTEKTRNYMRAAFDGAEWAVRDPKVLRGTAVTSDNYWKGRYGNENAKCMVETYGCPDPYAVTEMEDIAVCAAVKRMGLLDRLIILRDSVNMDVFMLGATPESLWNPDATAMSLASEDSVEAADIFATAMKNNFDVGSVIIDEIMNGGI